MRRARADGTKRKNDTEVSEMVGLTKSEIENLLKVRTNGFLNSTAADAKKLQVHIIIKSTKYTLILEI